MTDITPGPWYHHPVVGLEDEDWWEVDNIQHAPRIEALPAGYRDICILPRRGAQDEANAIAIAALPQLLAAAEGLLAWRELMTAEGAAQAAELPRWRALRLAVARAKGIGETP